MAQWCLSTSRARRDRTSGWRESAAEPGCTHSSESDLEWPNPIRTAITVMDGAMVPLNQPSASGSNFRLAGIGSGTGLYPFFRIRSGVAQPDQDGDHGDGWRNGASQPAERVGIELQVGGNRQRNRVVPILQNPIWSGPTRSGRRSR